MKSPAPNTRINSVSFDDHIKDNEKERSTSRNYSTFSRKYSVRRQSFNTAHELTDLIGGWGPFQWNIFMFDITVQIATMANVLTMSFMAPKVDFLCNDVLHNRTATVDDPVVATPPISPETPGYGMCYFPSSLLSSPISRTTIASIASTIFPTTESSLVTGNSTLSSLFEVNEMETSLNGTLLNNNTEGNNILIPCSSFTFDTQTYGLTLTSEYGLICDRNYLPSVSQALYVLGYLVASIVAGHCADRYGRLPVLWISVFGEIISGISSAFAFSFTHFMISRLSLGFFVYAKFMTAYTLVMEVAGSKERSIFGPLTRMGRSLGIIAITIVAYYIRNFRYLQLSVTVPQILWIYWLTQIPESPRWLICRGRIDEATKIVEEAIEVNGIDLSDKGIHGDVRYNLEKIYSRVQGSLPEENNNNDDNDKDSSQPNKNKNNHKQNNKSFLDLFRTPIVRKNSIIMCFNWFVTVFIYYALSLNVQDLGGNLYLNNLISGLVEIPSIILCIYALKTSGRRTMLSVSMIALFMASTVSIPFFFVSFDGAVPTRVALAMMGKFAATIAFCINYLYSTEIYPTEIRQIGLGVNSAISRFGSMLSPFIKELNEYTHVSVSMGIFGFTSLVNAILVMMLPETRGVVIPDTIEQVECGQVIRVTDKERMREELAKELAREIMKKKMSCAVIEDIGISNRNGSVVVCHIVNDPPNTTGDEKNDDGRMKY